MKDLGTLGGTFSQADGLTDSGDVVGAATTENDQAFHAFLWKENAMADLGTLPEDCDSGAYAINSNGRIIGDSFSCDNFTPRPFLWQNGHMYGFNIVPPSGTELILSEPASINDRGEIVGYSLLNTGFQAFLLIPCDQTEICEDVITTGTASAHSTSLPTSLNPITTAQRNLTTAEKVGFFRTRLNRRNHISEPISRGQN